MTQVEIPVYPKEIVLDRYPKGSQMSVTIGVRISNQFKARMWIAEQLMLLAMRVLGCQGTVDFQEVEG